MKVIKIDIPNFHESEDKKTPQETKRRMRERGIMPPRPWMERHGLSCVRIPYEIFLLAMQETDPIQ